MDIDSGRKRALRRLWKGESTFAEIAEDLGWSEATLTQAVAFLGLPERAEPEVYLPTPEEIRLECAKLRLARRHLDDPDR